MEVLRGLLAAGVDVPLVITQPDRPAGRRRILTPPAVAVFARAAGIPLLQPEHMVDLLAELQGRRPAAVAICAYGQMIPPALLEICPWLNLHPSLLPRWRGAAPIERALMAHDQESGVVIMRTVEALDAGPLITQYRFAIDHDDDAAALEQTALRLGVPALVAAIEAAANGTLQELPQANVGVLYASKLERNDRLIDPARDSCTVTHDRVRALRPQIGALLAIDDQVVTIWRTERTGQALAAGLCLVDDGRLIIGFADGALAVTVIQTAGRRALPIADWLRGHRCPPTTATRPS